MTISSLQTYVLVVKTDLLRLRNCLVRLVFCFNTLDTEFFLFHSRFFFMELVNAGSSAATMATTATSLPSQLPTGNVCGPPKLLRAIEQVNLNDAAQTSQKFVMAEN